MPKRTVEIDDNLDELVSGIKSEIRENFLSYLKENPDVDDFETYYQAQGCDAVHEIADSSTPVYDKDIDGLFYLYGDQFEEAYKNAGIGDGKEDNYRQLCIYCYLSDAGFDYLRELQTAFEEYLDDESEDKTIESFIPE